MFSIFFRTCVNVYMGSVYVWVCYGDGLFVFFEFVHFSGCSRIYVLCWGCGGWCVFVGVFFLSGFFYILWFCFVVCVLGVCFFVLLVVYFDSCCGWCCFGGVFVCLFWGLLLFLFFCCVLMCMWCVFFWVFVVFWGFLGYIYSFLGVGKTPRNQPLKNTIFYNFQTSIFSTEQLNILQSRLHYNEFFYAHVFFYNICYILFCKSRSENI